MVYFDNAATTKIAPEVLDAMLPYLKEEYGNPGSLHSIGRSAKLAIDKARIQVADFIKAKPEQIIFTSGGTEANNLAIKGVAEYLTITNKPEIITSRAEHVSVLKSVEKMCTKGRFYAQILDTNNRGFVESSVLRNAISENTGLVAMMYVNNETGAENPVVDFSKISREHGALFFTDCVQAAGCQDINVDEIGCDLLSVSSHKIHGSKGVGALYVRDHMYLSPEILGGRYQEFGVRGGTENVAGIVGFGKACEIAELNRRETEIHTTVLKQTLFTELKKALADEGMEDVLSVNGESFINRGKVINLRFRGIDGETLALMLDGRGFSVSTGSACNGKESTPSHVLRAIGLSEEEARESVRVSFSKYNTVGEVFDFVGSVVECVFLLKNILE